MYCSTCTTQVYIQFKQREASPFVFQQPFSDVVQTTNPFQRCIVHAQPNVYTVNILVNILVNISLLVAAFSFIFLTTLLKKRTKSTFLNSTVCQSSPKKYLRPSVYLLHASWIQYLAKARLAVCPFSPFLPWAAAYSFFPTQCLQTKGGTCQRLKKLVKYLLPLALG